MRYVLILLMLDLTAPACAQDGLALVASARTQIGVTTVYDPAYVTLDFPGGDVDPTHGVCTDVIVRALRSGWGIDLQLAVNRDMAAHFSAYPAKWGLKATDRNIDHRRVGNLQTLFARLGADLPPSADAKKYLPGDIVSWLLPGNLPHIGIVSDQWTVDRSTPLVLHNIGAGAAEDDILFAFQMTGHYRLTPDVMDKLKMLDTN